MENKQEWNYRDALQGVAQLLIHGTEVPIAQIRQLLCNPEVKVLIIYVDGTTSNGEMGRPELETYEVRSRAHSFLHVFSC